MVGTHNQAVVSSDKRIAPSVQRNRKMGAVVDIRPHAPAVSDDKHTEGMHASAKHKLFSLTVGDICVATQGGCLVWGALRCVSQLIKRV